MTLTLVTLALLASGIALSGTAFVTRWPVASTGTATPELPDLRGWFARWQIQHRAPDLDPSKTIVLRLFLTFTYRLATPLARLRIRPGVVTLAGLWLACTVPTIATRWPAIAAVVCVFSSLVDGVDGAVAGLTNRASATGFVLDSFVDRLAELAFFGALVVVGGHLSLAAGGWAAVILVEYVRARAGNAGLDEVGVVTVAERPTRVLCVVFGLLGAAFMPAHARTAADGAAIIAIVTAVVGLAQLGATIHRRLT